MNANGIVKFFSPNDQILKTSCTPDNCKRHHEPQMASAHPEGICSFLIQWCCSRPARLTRIHCMLVSSRMHPLEHLQGGCAPVRLHSHLHYRWLGQCLSFCPIVIPRCMMHPSGLHQERPSLMTSPDFFLLAHTGYKISQNRGHKSGNRLTWTYKSFAHHCELC